MDYQPTWKERWEDARVFVGPAVAGLIVIGVLGWVAKHQLAPARKSDTTAAAVSGDEKVRATARAALAVEVGTLETTYRRALEADAPGGELETLLGRAIQKQTEFMKLEARPSVEESARLARLEAMRGTLRSGVAAARSALLEEEAVGARNVGREAEATEKLREALRLQRSANASAPGPELKNLARESKLASLLEEADAEPLHAAIEAARTLAAAAGELGKNTEATKAYQEARAAQVELNSKFPGSRYADVAALDRYDAEIASIAAGGLAKQVAARERDGDLAVAARKMDEAAKAFGEAMEWQREINEKYPRSRYASPARLEEFGVRRETALSVPALEKAAQLTGEVTGLLRLRSLGDATAKLSEAAGLLERAAQAQPRSRGLDPALRRKIDFLTLKRADLAPVQEQVYARLLRVPGGPEMFGTEIPQELYARVMNTNPSRNAGRMFPVDSVSWDDAQEFCQRLSWMLGGRVRLPTEAEFRAVLDRGPGAMWAMETADGHSHEVGKAAANAIGFFDLAGNVAEWLQPPVDAGEMAPVAGGSYLDPAETLRRGTVTMVEKRERARHIGFRIVVEWPAD